MEVVRRRAYSDIVSPDPRENGEAIASAAPTPLAARQTRSQRGQDGFRVPKSRASSGVEGIQRQEDIDQEEEVWEKIEVFCNFKGGSQPLQIFPPVQDPSVLPITSRLRQNLKRSRPDYVENSDGDDDDDDVEEEVDSADEDVEDDVNYKFKCYTCSKGFMDPLTLRAHTMIHLFEEKPTRDLPKVEPDPAPKEKDSGTLVEVEPEPTPSRSSSTAESAPAASPVAVEAEPPPPVEAEPPPPVPAPQPEVAKRPTLIPRAGPPKVSPLAPIGKADFERFRCFNCEISYPIKELAKHVPCPVIKAPPTEVITLSSDSEEDVVTLSD